MHTVTARDRFPQIVVLVLAAFIVAAFARTYYLRVLFDLPPLSRAAHLHGILATAWLALHYTQARLVAAHRVDWHRRLGIFGALLGTVLTAQVLMLGIARVAAGHAPPGRDPLQFLSVSFGTTLMFAGFLAGALAMRRRREWHKRLMLLASFSLLVPAAGRIDSLVMVPLGLPRGAVAFMATVVFVMWACVHDWRKRGRVHPALLYGGPLLVASMPLRMWIGYQPWWLPVAKWLVAVGA